MLLFGCTTKESSQTPILPPDNNSYACNPDENCIARKNTSDVIDPDMTIISFDDSLNYLNDTVALFYSFDNCPWCYDAIQVLNNVYKDYSVPTYYVEVERDERVDENSTYQVLIEKFSSEIEDKMYVPFFVVLKDGVVLGSNTGTVEDHIKVDGVLPIINEEQKIRLADIYTSLYNKIS